MAFPKEKTDWLNEETSTRDISEPISRTKKLLAKNILSKKLLHIVSSSEKSSSTSDLRKQRDNPENRGKRLEFFKSISISPPIDYQKNNDTYHSNDVGHQAATSANFTALKDIKVSGPSSLSKFKQLISGRVKPLSDKRDYSITPNREISATPSYHNVTNSFIQERWSHLGDTPSSKRAESSSLGDYHATERFALDSQSECGEVSSGDSSFARNSDVVGSWSDKQTTSWETRTPLFEGSKGGMTNASNMVNSSLGNSPRQDKFPESQKGRVDSSLKGEKQIKQEDPVVRCPACQTRFYVDAEVLAKYQQSGRKPQFHCSKCDHVFSSSIVNSAPDINIDEVINWNTENNGDEAKPLQTPVEPTLSETGFAQQSRSPQAIDTGSFEAQSPQIPGNQVSSQYTDDSAVSSDATTSQAISIASHSISSQGKMIYPDDDQPLVTHFDDEVKPQNIPWEVKRSTSDGTAQQMRSPSRMSGMNLNQALIDEFSSSGIRDVESANRPVGSSKGVKKTRKRQGKRGLGDGLSIWTLAKKAFKTGGYSLGGANRATKSSTGQSSSSSSYINPQSGSQNIAVAQPYLNSSLRRPNSAPIESVAVESDQLALSLTPSKPSAWQLLKSVLARGPRERWVGTALLGSPLLVMILILAVFSYSIRFSLPAYELVASSLGLKSSEIAPVGLTVHDATFKSIVLESGETVYTISGRVANSTDRDFKEISVEGLTFNAQGRLIAKGSATLGNALSIAKLKALPVEDILTLQRKKRDASATLRPGQSEKFIIALVDKPLAEDKFKDSSKSRYPSGESLTREKIEASTKGDVVGLTSSKHLDATEFFSARVYLVK